VREGLIRSNPARDADLPHCSEGRNAVQVQRWLGHHSPAFTLATYVHLLDGDLGEPLAVPSEGMGACYGAIQKC
jgi:integrase